MSDGYLEKVVIATEINADQLYVFAFVMAGLGYLFGYLVAKSGYKDRFKKDISSFKSALDQANHEKEKAIIECKKEVAKVATEEWNRGREAAYKQLIIGFRFIQQWELDHGMPKGDVEALSQKFELFAEESKEEK